MTPPSDSPWLLLLEALDSANQRHVDLISDAVAKEMPYALGHSILRLLDDYRRLMDERGRG